MNKEYIQTILLVDDDPKNLQIAMKILKKYKVIFAQSGEKALELLEKNNFDLILLDIVMPMMDGYETCKKIKSNEKFKDIPVIFSTVKDEEKDIVKGFELGAVDYLTKPFFPEVLLKRVEVHLSLSQSTFELKELNNSLSQKVSNQVEEIRKKDEILAKQEKMKVMNELIGVLSDELRKPMSNIKIYLQSFEIMFESNENKVLSKSFNKILSEIKGVEAGLNDFSNMFSVKKEIANHNLKVILDGVTFKFNEELKKHNIKFSFEGDNLLSLNISKDDFKQIFSKLLLISLDSFSKSKIEKKEIIFKLSKIDNILEIDYSDNSSYSKFDDINKFFDINYLIKNKKFDIDFYVLKSLVEKNDGDLLLQRDSLNGIFYKIKIPIGN